MVQNALVEPSLLKQLLRSAAVLGRIGVGVQSLRCFQCDWAMWSHAQFFNCENPFGKLFHACSTIIMRRRTT